MIREQLLQAQLTEMHFSARGMLKVHRVFGLPPPPHMEVNHPERTFLNCSAFEVLTVVSVKSNIFWVVMSCKLAENYRHFGGMFCLHYKKSLLLFYVFLVTSLAYTLTLKFEAVISKCL
jgi:hypothetical protein